MQKGFWKTIKKPFFALAPMADVTDPAFRRIIAKYGKPDVLWTEFVSCDGLCSSGREKLLRDLWFDRNQSPILAQFFGSTPKHFYECARLAKELGFDGIDINMGCPDRSVEKQNAGAALIKNFDLAKEVIQATKEGAGELPVSVKTRLGYNADILEDWLGCLLSADLSAITIHARTRKEMSKTQAHWNRIADAVSARNAFDSSSDHTLIIGNGDVENLFQAQQKIDETGADGVMIGRGIFGNPWLFDSRAAILDIPLAKKLEVMVEHTRLFEAMYGVTKNFDVMKKHYKAYVSGFDGAKELRIELMNSKNADQVEAIVNRFLKK
jgi:nifR3 family TIM-barrel protein